MPHDSHHLTPLRERLGQRKRQRDLKAMGLCICCGKIQARPGILRCEKCQTVHLESTRRYCHRRRDAARKLGICLCCLDRKAMPGRSRCGACAEANTECQARHRAAKREAGQ